MVLSWALLKRKTFSYRGFQVIKDLVTKISKSGIEHRRGYIACSSKISSKRVAPMTKPANKVTVNRANANREKRFFTRIRIYLLEMHPPRNWASSLIFFMSAWNGIALLCAVPNQKALMPKIVPVVGALTIMLMLLLLRIMDELKDLETDRQHFPIRPVPRGDVYPLDLRLLGLFIIGILLILNLYFTRSATIFLVVFGYACLMYKYFFLKALISQNILLALATHNPISYFLFLYVAALYRDNAHLHILPNQVILLGAVFLFCFMSWEISRKIRHPEDETAYQTYSMVLGTKAALLIPVILSGASVIVIFWLYRDIFSGFSFIVMLLGLLFLVMMFFRFYRRRPNLLSLKLTTEIFIITIQSVLVMEGFLIL
jgi:4-hydroxybenzoate polyprenyltransferase